MHKKNSPKVSLYTSMNLTVFLADNSGPNSRMQHAFLTTKTQRSASLKLNVMMKSSYVKTRLSLTILLCFSTEKVRLHISIEDQGLPMTLLHGAGRSLPAYLIP